MGTTVLYVRLPAVALLRTYCLPTPSQRVPIKEKGRQAFWHIQTEVQCVKYWVMNLQTVRRALLKWVDEEENGHFHLKINIHCFSFIAGFGFYCTAAWVKWYTVLKKYTTESSKTLRQHNLSVSYWVAEYVIFFFSANLNAMLSQN